MNTQLEELVAQRTAELQASNDRLKKEVAAAQSDKMAAVGQLAAGVAHDFNNILAVIQGNAGLLLEIKPPGDKDIESLESICTAVDRASKLVRQLLTLSRRQLPDIKASNLLEVVTPISEMLPEILTPKIDVKVTTHGEVPNVSVDPAMLENLMVNLAVNARDAMPDGGRLKISIDSVDILPGAPAASPDSRPGKFARLSVTDTGSGIPPEVLPRIFEPFFTTKPVGKGTGLGLATVYGIARQHHGWVEVQSKLNEGTTFHILIPAAAAPKTAKAPAPTKAGLPARVGETILVVEDEPDLRELVTQILESAGYKVAAASCGAEALEAWAKYHADVRLLLTDMMLPDGITGRILADRFTGEKPGLRVIFTSGYSAGMPGTELAQIEARQFLAKPYRPAALVEIVRRCLDEPQAQAAGAPA